MIKKNVKINIFVEVQCQAKKDNTLRFNQYMKSDEMPHIIYDDLESLIKR